MERSGGDHISGSVTGTVSGQVAIGKDIAQTQTIGPADKPTPEEMDELRSALAALREQIAAQAPQDRRESALERADELEQAVMTDDPDLTTMEYARNWFAKNLPQLAGTVTSVVVHPVVGKIVQAAGEAVAAGWRTRFGA